VSDGPPKLRLGFIGYGTIATLALEALARSRSKPLDAVICLARPEGVGRATSLFENCPRLAREFRIVTEVEALIEARPLIVAEAAGHEAVRTYAAPLLTAGIDVLVTSTGSLADPVLRADLEAAQLRGHSRMSLCAGAVGGLDILAAAQLSGIEDVIYTSRKPPRAWRGTPAERLLDLETLGEATTFYEGTADVAATDFPQNANVAATVALVGAGFERTRVRLVADPGVDRNIHEIHVRAACADIDIRIAGRAAADNPKTSLTTAYALAADLAARFARA
jgi:aspartate dehydrogenase